MADNENKPPTAFLYFREICELIRRTAPYIATVLTGYWALLMVRALAGKFSSAEIHVLIDTFGDKAAKPAPAWGVAVAAMIYGYLQRREKSRKINYLQDRIELLEKRLDPNRSSSELSTDGSTHPRDL